MKGLIDVSIYWLILAFSFWLGKIYEKDKREFRKYLNKIGHNPSPPDNVKRPEFPTQPRPERQGKKIKSTPPSIKKS